MISKIKKPSRPITFQNAKMRRLSYSGHDHGLAVGCRSFLSQIHIASESLSVAANFSKKKSENFMIVKK